MLILLTKNISKQTNDKKNLGRYAEDSLDARLRQVQDFEDTGSIEVDYTNENMNQVNL